MKRTYRWSVIGAAVLVMGTGLFAASSAQTPDERHHRPSEATIYRDDGYRGPAVFVGEAKPNLGLAWPVNSIRVASGRWELCERTRYRGPLPNGRSRHADAGQPRARAHHPVDPPGRDGAGEAAGTPIRPPTTKSRAAISPNSTPSRQSGNYRVSCLRSADRRTRTARRRPPTPIAARSAGTGSAREHMETVSGRVYLADVLCVRSGY
jgi:hypothetical protein